MQGLAAAPAIYKYSFRELEEGINYRCSTDTPAITRITHIKKDGSMENVTYASGKLEDKSYDDAHRIGNGRVIRMGAHATLTSWDGSKYRVEMQFKPGSDPQNNGMRFHNTSFEEVFESLAHKAYKRPGGARRSTRRNRRSTRRNRRSIRSRRNLKN